MIIPDDILRAAAKEYCQYNVMREEQLQEQIDNLQLKLEVAIAWIRSTIPFASHDWIVRQIEQRYRQAAEQARKETLPIQNPPPPYLKG